MTGGELNRAAEVIAGAASVALMCHRIPDGDALGSLLGLHHLCLANGKPSVASWPEPFEVAPHYRWMPGLGLATKPGDFPRQPEVVVTFDCGSLDRLGELAVPALAARELIVLDHHASNDRYGTINVIDTEAAATAVVVRRLAERLGWPLTRNAAMCLYTGLVTDTGRFQYSNTTPEVFALAEELASHGLPIEPMNRQLFESARFDALRMIGAVLERCELDRDLSFVVTWVTRFDLDGFGVLLEETEGLIDLVRRTTEAEVSCVCKEADDGIRVSLRSVSDIDVSKIAAVFGGGGHKYAAGFTAPYPVTDVIAGIKAELRKQRDERQRLTA